MHEYSLVRRLLAQVRETAGPHSDAAVEEVVITIGPLAGVEPLLVASAFEFLVCDTPFAATRLVIEQVPLRLTCAACDSEYKTMDVDFACPNCLSRNTRVTDGDGVMLRHLVLRELQPEESAP